jgi:hypothetical protein
MAIGLSAFGGFAEGLTEGYKGGTALRLAQQKDEREAKAFDLQQESAKIDLDNKKRDAAYQQELQERMTQLNAQLKGGVVGGEAEDEFGTAIGKVQYGSAAEAEQAMKTQGLRFKQGTAIETPAMDPIDFQLKAADVLKEVAAKYGKVDLKMLKDSRDFGRQIQSEGAIDALKYFMTNPSDQEGAKAMFNKRGKIKLGDDVQLGMKDGMFGPTVFGYKLGPKGEKIEVFDGFRDIILPSMSPEAYASTMASFKGTEVKEKGENVRLGAKLSSDENIAAGKNKIDRAKLDLDRTKALDDVMKNRFSGIFRNPIDNAEAARQKTIETAIGQRAEQYLATGEVGVQEAVNRAQADVFRDFKVDTSELAPKKK